MCSSPHELEGTKSNNRGTQKHDRLPRSATCQPSLELNVFSTASTHTTLARPPRSNNAVLRQLFVVPLALQATDRGGNAGCLAVHDAAVHGHRGLRRHRLVRRPLLQPPALQLRLPHTPARRERRGQPRDRRQRRRGAPGPCAAARPRPRRRRRTPNVLGTANANATAAVDCCAVCLEELRDGALVRMLASCKHYFHAECVDVWLLSHATCPVCRGSPGQEMARLGVLSLSPPLPQLRRPLPDRGGTSSGAKDIVPSSSPSPVKRSLMRFEVGGSAMSPSQPTHRPGTLEVTICRTRSPSPVTAG
jgi:hypothetical protein